MDVCCGVDRCAAAAVSPETSTGVIVVIVSSVPSVFGVDCSMLFVVISDFISALTAVSALELCTSTMISCFGSVSCTVGTSSVGTSSDDGTQFFSGVSFSAVDSCPPPPFICGGASAVCSGVSNVQSEV